jgi:hypothetical protein
VEGEAVDHFPIAQGEELYRRAVPVHGEPDHVDRPDRALVGGLPLRKALDREQAIPVARGLLEALPGGRLAHPRLELAADRAGLAREELDHAVDDLAVVRLRDRRDTGGLAPLDVVVEARDPRVPTRLRSLAGTELEHPVENVERLPHLLRVRVGPEVDGAAAVPLPREHHAWERVGDGHGDVRERLVVAQPHVEGRTVALDEVLLEMERLGLALCDDHVDPVDPLDELFDPGAHVATPVEVAAHTGPERLRLPDVEDVVAVVAKEVDTRACRKLSQLSPNGIFTHAS